MNVYNVLSIFIDCVDDDDDDDDPNCYYSDVVDVNSYAFRYSWDEDDDLVFLKLFNCC